MEAMPIFKALISLVFVIALIGITALALRYFLGERFIRKNLGKISDKRLKIQDFLVIDAKRKLVLIKRDDVEHLILIGAEKETIVEANIKNSRRKK